MAYSILASLDESKIKKKEAEKPNGGISVKINESKTVVQPQPKEPVKKVVLERIGTVEK